MSIAARITILFICAALSLCCAFTAYTAYREYHIALGQVVDTALAGVLSRPQLQVQIYQRDEAGLQQVLAEFAEAPGISSAIVRDGLGEVLARRVSAAQGGQSQPSFSTLRAGVPAADTSLLALDADMSPADTGLLAAWRDTDLPIYLTAPVFTAANPGQRGLTARDFFEAPPESAANNSQRVIGYLQFELARSQLLDMIGPGVGRVFYTSLSLAALMGLLVALLSRRITAGLTQLARLAGQVASGSLQKPVDVDASGEIGEIARVLNSTIGLFANSKKETDVDHRLLRMKVDERTTQLSRREEELSRAAQEITQTRSKLQHLAYYDSLTALPNRRLFTEQLDLLLDLNQRNGHTLALLFLNLDNFKRVNDSLGHKAGDRVLAEIGNRLAGSVRDSDRVAHNVEAGQRVDVARMGGDEFTLVLNQLDTVESVAAVVRRLLEVLREPITIDEHELVISPSIGIAVAPRDGEDVESLLRSAGIAMHHAKASTRESYLFYRSDMDASGVGHLKLAAELRGAIERNQLVLHYQPQVNTLTGSVVGAEALLRWEHPELGMMHPQEFMPLAEEIGVIAALGDWVLEDVGRQLQEFDSAGVNLPRVVVNVSAVQFNPDFVARVGAVLEQFTLSASRLELGLSAATLLDSDEAVNHCLDQLRERGVRLSVHDFGAGYTPLSYLAYHVLDEIRIDKRFVTGCEKDPKRGRLLAAIAAMTRSLELGVLVEGVENEEQYRFIANHGAHVIQGPLFSEPVPADRLRPLLAPWHFIEQLQSIQV